MKIRTHKKPFSVGDKPAGELGNITQEEAKNALGPFAPEDDRWPMPRDDDRGKTEAIAKPDASPSNLRRWADTFKDASCAPDLRAAADEIERLQKGSRFNPPDPTVKTGHGYLTGLAHAERTPLGEKLADSIIKEQETPHKSEYIYTQADMDEQCEASRAAGFDAARHIAAQVKDHITGAFSDHGNGFGGNPEVGEPLEPVAAESIKEMEAQLHAARYAFHKVTCKRYGDMAVAAILSLDEARERYRLAMVNYDGIIEVAANGHLTEADEADMGRGFPL